MTTLADPVNSPLATWFKRRLPLPVKQALRVVYVAPAYVRALGVWEGTRTVVRLVAGRGEYTRIALPGLAAPFVVRNYTSDVAAFGQVFLRQSYAIPFAFTPGLIIDGGSNVGSAAVYFATRFPEAAVVAVEPDGGNFGVLRMNAAAYPTIVPVQGAVWSQRTRLALQNPEDEGWKQRVGEAPAGGGSLVEAYTVGDLLALFPGRGPVVLKLDVEGAEKQIFSGDCSWLAAVEMVIIEVHDRIEPGASEAVLAALGDAFVIIGQWGENFVAQRVK